MPLLAAFFPQVGIYLKTPRKGIHVPEILQTNNELNLSAYTSATRSSETLKQMLNPTKLAYFLHRIYAIQLLITQILPYHPTPVTFFESIMLPAEKSTLENQYAS